MDFERVSRPFNGERIVFPASDARTIRYLYAKSLSWTSTSHYIKYELKTDQVLNVRAKTINS